MKTLRKIVINKTPYWWRFTEARGYICNSNLTIVDDSRKIKFIVRFTTMDTFTGGNPLNEGLPMTKGDKKYSINLNQPGYVAEILQYILDNKLTETTKHQEFNGNELLSEMGYEECEEIVKYKPVKSESH